MQKHYRQCLDKLAGDAPERKAALIRSLLPGIEAAVNSGQSLKKIWEALASEGLQMSYHSFHKTVSRSRQKRKPTPASHELRHQVCGLVRKVSRPFDPAVLPAMKS